MIGKNIAEYYQLCAATSPCLHSANYIKFVNTIFTDKQITLYFRLSIGKYKLREEIIGGSDVIGGSDDTVGSSLPAIDDYLDSGEDLRPVVL